jgi:hypothetical protein
MHELRKHKRLQLSRWADAHLRRCACGFTHNVKPRPIEGALDVAKKMAPQALLLDGQQRMTSLYQVTIRRRVVETVTPTGPAMVTCAEPIRTPLRNTMSL